MRGSRTGRFDCIPLSLVAYVLIAHQFYSRPYQYIRKTSSKPCPCVLSTYPPPSLQLCRISLKGIENNSGLVIFNYILRVNVLKGHCHG